MLLQFLINGIIIGSIYSLVALGFALVYNTTRIFHVAYAVVYMFCPYMILTFYHDLGLPILLAFLSGILITVLLSVLMDFIVYRPLLVKRSSTNILMISSIGIMIIVINVIALVYGNETKILSPEVSQAFSFWNIIITYTQMSQFLISLILLLLFFLFLKYSKFGIMTRAIRDDNELAQVLGLNISKMRYMLFAISGLFAAIGGGLMAYDVGMDPYVGMPMFLNAVVALIIGGVGRFEAPILGGFIIGILQAVSIWAFSAKWQEGITFLLLILFLLFKPDGILGERKRMV